MKPEQLAADIIKEQSLIIGESLARSRAEVTGSLKFTSDKIGDVVFTGSDPTSTLENLIESYAEVFGQASIEVCVDVIKKHSLNDTDANFLEPLKKRYHI